MSTPTVALVGDIAPLSCKCIERHAGIPMLRERGFWMYPNRTAAEAAFETIDADDPSEADERKRVFATTSPVPGRCAYHLGSSRSWCFVEADEPGCANENSPVVGMAKPSRRQESFRG